MGEYMDNLQIVCAKLGSEVCTGQSSDCPDPNFAHNIHVYTNTVSKQYSDMTKYRYTPALKLNAISGEKAH